MSLLRRRTETETETRLLMEIRDLLRAIAMNTSPQAHRLYETKEHGEHPREDKK